MYLPRRIKKTEAFFVLFFVVIIIHDWISRAIASNFSMNTIVIKKYFNVI